MKSVYFNPRKKIILILLACLVFQYAGAQLQNSEAMNPETMQAVSEKKRCNFYIFTQDASRKFDFLGTTALVRICIKSAFLKKKLYVIVAKNSRQVARKIISILNEQNGMIGNIWIDSHGLYKQGYSSFHLGSDEFNYKNIHDSSQTVALKLLSAYCDGETNIGIGSCYGGATFTFPGSATVAPGRMNGDSLMMGMGAIFPGTVIYGSESWVMEKPGIFNNKFGFAGYPLGKRYRTTYWKPVWERLGKWNRYSTVTGSFEPINTVALSRSGTIRVRARGYQELGKGQKAVAKNLSMLEPATVLPKEALRTLPSIVLESF